MHFSMLDDFVPTQPECVLYIISRNRKSRKLVIDAAIGVLTVNCVRTRVENETRDKMKQGAPLGSSRSQILSFGFIDRTILFSFKIAYRKAQYCRIGDRFWFYCKGCF